MTTLLDRLKAFVHSGEHYVIALGKEELKVGADTPLGQSIHAAITAGEAGTTPAEKMTLALTSFLPTLKGYIADPAALESDLETAGKIILESALAIVKTTGPLAIIQALAAAAV